MNRQTLVVLLVGGVAGAAGIAGFVLIRPPAAPPKAVSSASRTGVPEAPELRSKLPARGARANSPAGRSPASGIDRSPNSDAPAAAVTAAPEPESPTLGTLRIDSDVAGANVFIDRQHVGVTPVTVPDVTPGPHRLNVSVAGYDPVSEPIEVAAGPRDITLKFKEVRLNRKIDVVHGHRMGSCKGVLIGTPQGLRYDTVDKNDAFSVALVDIETLQIDYLEKRLRIAVRGKRYDFTDPEGNADRLLTFHRDVEKARDRLRKGDPPAPD